MTHIASLRRRASLTRFDGRPTIERFAWGLSSRGTSFYGTGSSLVIDIGSLLHAGRPISLDDTVVVPPFGLVRFPHPAHVAIDLRREEKGVHLSGSIDVDAAGECDRCLDDVVVPLSVDVDERFDPVGGSSDPFGDNNVLSGTDLDIGDLVRQLVTAALPFGLVCRADCRGLCATCGLSKNAGGGCDCPEMEGENGEP